MDLPQSHLLGLEYVEHVSIFSMIDVIVHYVTQFQGAEEEQRRAMPQWNWINEWVLVGPTWTPLSKMVQQRIWYSPPILYTKIYGQILLLSFTNKPTCFYLPNGTKWFTDNVWLETYSNSMKTSCIINVVKSKLMTYVFMPLYLLHWFIMYKIQS